MTMRKTGENMYIFEFLPGEHYKEYFNGSKFSEKYSGALFLSDTSNLYRILWHGEELRKCVEHLTPGEQLTIEGMAIKTGVPLVIRKSGCPDESDIGNEEFTLRRLTGLVSAYTQMMGNNDKLSCPLRIPEARALGLFWNCDHINQTLCFSAVPGAEYFTKQFQLFPFICALRKYQLNIISEDEVHRIVKVMKRSTIGFENMTWTQFFKSYVYSRTACERHFLGKPFSVADVVASLPQLDLF